MTSRHFNPMESRPEREAGDEYTQHELRVLEIRSNSVLVEVNSMSNRHIGRSLFHAASDDRLTNYRGPLPVDMVLTVKTWWLQRFGFIRGDE